MGKQARAAVSCIKVQALQVLHQVFGIGQGCPKSFLPPLAFIYLFLRIWHKTLPQNPGRIFKQVAHSSGGTWEGSPALS